MPGHERVHQLLQKYHEGNASAAELEELLRLIDSVEYNDEMKILWNSLSPDASIFDEEKSAQMLQQILKGKRQDEAQSAPVVQLKSRNRKTLWISAAASVIVLISVTTFFILNKQSKPEITAQSTRNVQPDITAPAGSKAVLRFADGSIIALEEAADGSLAVQGNVNIVKLANGEIVYQGKAQGPTEVSYNTLIVPRGSKVVSLTLADGSRIWMNAESSLTYPTAFVGKERIVDLKGEAFFDIASNKNMPFIVRKNDMQVEVTGTSFNVNAYEDEETIDITLLEGSVDVKKGNASTSLKPGQQAQVNNTGGIRLVEHADTEAAVAWKNGYFQFNGNDIQTVMRQISRWYDVDIEYEGKVPDRKFAGQMDRTSKLSSLLRILEESDVHFKTEGRKVIVMP